MIVSRDWFKVVPDGGRIGKRAGRKEHEVYEGIDIAVMGEVYLDARSAGARGRPDPLGARDLRPRRPIRDEAS